MLLEKQIRVQSGRFRSLVDGAVYGPRSTVDRGPRPKMPSVTERALGTFTYGTVTTTGGVGGPVPAAFAALTRTT